ncbi:unnamed protein product [Cunninghamella blakesleeana]
MVKLSSYQLQVRLRWYIKLKMDNTYKYPYSGKDEYLIYFSDNDIKDWSYQDFKRYFFSTLSNTPLEETALSIYLTRMNNILVDCKTPKNIKTIIKEYIKSTKSEEPKSSQVFNNFGSGTIQHNNGDGFIITPPTNNTNDKKNNENKSNTEEEEEEETIQIINQYNIGTGTFNNNNHPVYNNEASVSASQQQQEKINKKRKLEEYLYSDDIPFSNIDFHCDDLYNNFIVDQDSVWKLWSRLFEKLSRDEDLHSWSLEKLNIVQCGNKLGHRIQLPTELCDMLNDPHTLISPFKSSNQEYVCEILDAPNTAAMLQKIQSSPPPDEELSFIINIITIFAGTVFKGKNISNSESNFSFRIVWPLMELLTSEEVVFECGEYILKSMKEECKRRIDDSHVLKNSQYKSDGCFLYNDNIEIGLLEVSGAYGNNDIKRHTKDHIKAGFGMLAMLNNLARKYKFGSFDIFSSIRFFFIHVKEKRLRLWSFEMANSGIYIMNMIDHVNLPSDREICEHDIRHLIKLLWTFKHLLTHTTKCIDDLKTSHINTMKSIARHHIPDNEVKELTSHLKFSKSLKLDVSYIPDSDDLVLTSSP